MPVLLLSLFLAGLLAFVLSVRFLCAGRGSRKTAHICKIVIGYSAAVMAVCTLLMARGA